MDKSPRYWFPAKRYGWGWGLPSCWQGWVVLLVYLALMIGGLVIVNPATSPNAYTAFAAVVTAVFMLVVWRTGEPPSWRSGAK
jgi:hypothetical protein